VSGRERVAFEGAGNQIERHGVFSGGGYRP
jgi:hypothetical protein